MLFLIVKLHSVEKFSNSKDNRAHTVEQGLKNL